MATWEAFDRAVPELAAFGGERVDGRVCFLATVRRDGGPRVHPVTPWIAMGRLFVRMYPTSPKVADLVRDPRYALHSMMDNDEGEGGEISIRGRASVVTDSSVVADAFDAIGGPGTNRTLILFELSLDEVATTVYEGEETIRRRWRASGDATG